MLTGKATAPLLAVAITAGVLAPLTPSAASDGPVYFAKDGTWAYQNGGKRGDIVVIRVTGEDIKMGNALAPCWAGYLINDGMNLFYRGGGDNQQGVYEDSGREFWISGSRIQWYGTGDEYPRWYHPIPYWRAKARMKTYYGARIGRVFSDCYRFVD